ncbi:hypothetical protein [Burkholderia multivorans]|uniref:hypothetical protein n=2 Tax=Burkholderia multivorans TaxID=87883 RepID=UPI0020112BC8|nr:hypothetical protein [Burkholderia multivorans]
MTMTTTIPSGTYSLEAGNGALMWATVVGNTLKVFDACPTEPVRGRLRVTDPTFFAGPDETTTHRLVGDMLHFTDANGIEKVFRLTLVESA